MTKFAVGYMNFFNNNLKVDIVEAENWKEALSNHSAFAGYSVEENTGWLPDDLETAKSEAFKADFLFDVVEIK